ncbi:MAG TPA: rod shape-determining protein MreC [Terriglobales bacterium]|nr:rod shape-determining protein MreC [Terriglobales bacterium]
METLISRYRNITVLLLVIFAQLVLLAYQVKNDSDVRLIRVWAVTAVTPVARAIEMVRGGTSGFLQNYIVLHDTRAENERMRGELGRLKIENQFLKAELSMADRAKALAVFESHSPSKMLAARVIATATGASAGAVFVDRGSTAGVEKGMGVVTPDGIVGKVLAAYPTASQVLLVTDPGFAAGVVSQKNHVHGILKGSGHGNCRVDYVQNEEKVVNGEWFYTSGDDRIFPRGLPAGQVTVARSGNPFQEIAVEPSAVTGGLEEVLIILQGVHQAVPEMKTAAQPIYLGQPPPAPQGDEAASSGQTAATGGSSKTPALATDADKLLEHYKDLGQAQGHKFGENPPGAKAVDFNAQVKPGEKPAAGPKPPAGGAAGTAGPAVTAAPKPAQVSPAPPVSQTQPDASQAGKPAPNPPQ